MHSPGPILSSFVSRFLSILSSRRCAGLAANARLPYGGKHHRFSFLTIRCRTGYKSVVLSPSPAHFSSSIIDIHTKKTYFSFVATSRSAHHNPPTDTHPPTQPQLQRSKMCYGTLVTHKCERQCGATTTEKIILQACKNNCGELLEPIDRRTRWIVCANCKREQEARARRKAAERARAAAARRQQGSK